MKQATVYALLRRVAVLTIFLITLIAPALGQPQPRYAFRHVGMEAGLSHERINSVCVGRRGFLWLATHWGLDCYDGNTVTSFVVPDSLLHGSEVLGAQEFGGDTMIVRLTKGYVLLKRNSLTFCRADDFLASRGATKALYGAYVDGRQNLWLIDGQKVIYSPSAKLSQSFDLPDSAKVSCVCPSRFGLAILLTDGRVLRCFPPAQGQTPTPQVFTTPLTGGAKAIRIDNEGDVWVISQRGDSLWHKPMVGNGWDLVNNRSYWSKNAIPQNITDVCVDTRKRIWLVSERNGACVLDPQMNRAIPLKRDAACSFSLRSNLCTCLAALNSGAIVVGYLHSGFSIYHPSAYKFVPLDVAPQEVMDELSDVRCLAGDTYGRRSYVATNAGGVYKIDMQTNESEKLPFDRGDVIDRMAALPDGSLWATVCGRGFARYGSTKGGRATVTYYGGQHSVPDPISLTAPLGVVGTSQDGCLWASVGRSVIAMPHASEPANIFTGCQAATMDDDVVAIRDDRDTTSVVVLTRSSFYRLTRRNGKIISTKLTDIDLRNDRPTDICSGVRGFYWIAVAQGVKVFDARKEGEMATLIKSIDLGQPAVAVTPDPRGGAVAALPSGACIFRVYPSDTEACGFRIVAGRYTETSGLLVGVNSPRATATMANGSVWIGAENGVNEYYVEIDDDSTVPPVSFSMLYHNGGLVMPSQEIGGVTPITKAMTLCTSLTLPSDDSGFELRLAVLGVPSPECLMYSCELMGSDIPEQITNSPKYKFPTLKPGEYTLRIVAVDSEGRKSEFPTDLKVTVYEPWYMSTILHIVLLLVIVATALALTFFGANRRGKRKGRKVADAAISKQDIYATLGDRTVPSAEIASLVLKSVAANVSTSIDVLADEIKTIPETRGLPVADSIAIRNLADRLISANSALASVAGCVEEEEEKQSELNKTSHVGRHDIVAVSRTVVRQVAAITHSELSVGFSTHLRNCVFDFDPEAFRLLLIDVVVDAIVSTAGHGFVRVLIEKDKYGQDTVSVSVCIGGERPTSSLYFCVDSDEPALPENMDKIVSSLKAKLSTRDYGDGLLYTYIHLPAKGE